MAYLNDKASSQNLIINLCFFFLSRLFGGRPLILPLPLQSAFFIHANKKMFFFFHSSDCCPRAAQTQVHWCKIKLPLSSTKAKRCITHTLALNEEYRCVWRKGANTFSCSIFAGKRVKVLLCCKKPFGLLSVPLGAFHPGCHVSFCFQKAFRNRPPSLTHAIVSLNNTCILFSFLYVT